MFDGQALEGELNSAIRANVEAISLMERYGKGKAEKEAAYNVALASRIAALRADGVAAGLCDKLAKGSREVAEAFVAWQCEEALYAAAKENVMLHKRRADVARERMQREWSATAGRAL